MRKFILLLVTLAFVFGGAVMAQEAVEPWVCPDGFAGQSLNVYNWSTYIAEDTIANFEAACGITVTYDTFESGEALVARLRAGNPGYDIVVPPNSQIPLMVEEGLLEPLDLSLIPNFANVTKELTDPAYDPGNTYTIPYQWGTIGIGYNTNKITDEITSWTQLFQYPGRTVAWLEDRKAMISIALLLLGYDPTEPTEEEIKAAKDYLIANGANVFYIAGDDGQELLARGEADLVIEYSGDIFQIMSEAEGFTYVLPEEGAPIWVDVIGIPTGAQNIPLAHVFIDYILHPQVSADISNYTAYGSPNQAAIDLGLIGEEFLENASIYPDAELMGRLFSLDTRVELDQVYNDAWDEIKIRIGQ